MPSHPIRRGAVALLAFALAAAAHAEFPEKPVTLIVPAGAGGSHDLTSRVITSVIPPYLGQAMIVKLVPGAAGQTGSAEAARSTPDGYTLLYSADSIDQIPKHVIDLPYDPDRDFVTVAQINTQTMSVVVRSDAAFQSYGDLVAAAKAAPGKIKFAHSGVWGPTFIVGAGLFGLNGIEINYVAYRGGGPSMRALLAGDTDFSIQAVSVIGAQGDRVRVLGSAGAKRHWDDVPTFAELGNSATLGEFRRVVFAPRKTPPEVLAVLRKAFADLQKDKTYTRLMTRLGANTVYMDGAEYEPLRAEQGRYFKKIVDQMTGK